MSENVVLTGFMATGKTTVGRMLANQLKRSFIDMDEIISEQAGKSIEKIFSEDGESTFRSLESDLCLQLSQKKNLVIATGGGALVDPGNRALLEKNGRLICLDADMGVILQRIQHGENPIRPLIPRENSRDGLERLLGNRQKAYSLMPWHIDTSHLDSQEVVSKASSIAKAMRLNVRYPDGKYPIWLGRGLLEFSGDIFYQALIPQGSRVAVVSPPVVAKHYYEVVMQGLNRRGYQPVLCLVEDGEANKTLSSVANLYDQFLAAGIQRGDTVVALGGGVTGDMAGFAAATYLRGIRFIQIATTLLAMVDSSVGGKTGVDLPQGKNLIGAFKQPSAVIVDPKVLQTLPQEEIRSGLAEVIKHGVIADPGLFERLENSSGELDLFWNGDEGPSLIARAVRVKKRVVEKDPFEEGLRAHLNLGHTTGHALEKLSHYKLRHGEGVSIGLLVSARISAKMGISASLLFQRIQAILELWKLPVNSPPFLAEKIVEAMAHDKKKLGGQLRWVLPTEIGQVGLYHQVPTQLVLSVLKEMGAK